MSIPPAPSVGVAVVDAARTFAMRLRQGIGAQAQPVDAAGQVRYFRIFPTTNRATERI